MSDLNIETIRGHVPEGIYTSNIYVSKFINILDELLLEKQSAILKYCNSENPSLIGDINVLKKFVDDFAGDYFGLNTIYVLEQLYFYKHYIFSRKGTEEGLIKFLEIVTEGDVLAVDYSNIAKNLLHFNTLDGGILPEGEDLAFELFAEFNGYDPPRYVATLLDDSWESYYGVLSITIVDPFLDTPEFKKFLKFCVCKYLGLGDIGSLTVTINFIV
jgi:hypothetical protein